jgi:ParB/RepB/Spo0J family partition protein
MGFASISSSSATEWRCVNGLANLRSQIGFRWYPDADMPRRRPVPDAPQATPRPEPRRIQVDSIDVPQLRIRRDLGAIDELAYSLSNFGLLHPVHVYESHARYRLIAGQRRLEAARKLGWTSIDAMVRAPDENDLLLELVENTQRKWLSDAEEADALIRLVREMGCEMKEVAAQAGRSEAYVSKRVRVFEDATLRAAVEGNQMPVSVAEEFLALGATERPGWVARAIAGGWEGWRVREAIRACATGADAACAAHSKTQQACPEMGPPPGPGRRSSLAQQIRTLDRALRDLRPFQLSRPDEKALADLLQTLLRLARAHAGRGRSGVVFPSIEEAEHAAASRRRSS